MAAGYITLGFENKVDLVGLMGNYNASIPMSSFQPTARGGFLSYKQKGGHGQLIRAMATLKQVKTAEIMTSMNLYFRTARGDDDNIANNLTLGRWSVSVGWDPRDPRIDLGDGLQPFALSEARMSLHKAFGIAAVAAHDDLPSPPTWTVAILWKPVELPTSGGFITGEVCWSLQGTTVAPTRGSATSPRTSRPVVSCQIGTKSGAVSCGAVTR